MQAPKNVAKDFQILNTVKTDIKAFTGPRDSTTSRPFTYPSLGLPNIVYLRSLTVPYTCIIINLKQEELITPKYKKVPKKRELFYGVTTIT